MRHADEIRVAPGASPVDHSRRGAALICEAGMRAWRRSGQLSKPRSFAVACVGAVGLSLALCGTWAAWTDLGEASVTANWQHARAVILATSIEHGCGGDPGAYQARVRYRYEVAGTVYIGENASSGGTPCSSEHEARDEAARHPVDSKTTVRYDPVRVSQSALRVAESAWAGWLRVAAMVALIGVCGLCAGRGLHGVLSNTGAHSRGAS
ncbi:DUF3592 domain-containing protein [Scleromatobacter humisilvae]|uniref:DUF3592 domain-containing protein n=1 Tax=Scleromatobacter humisilvae TaxID=2897159 RepID=A0A9X1YQG5_9BURK|nr:DUF3592 domain-containing protein [Scleromatobacter humisilvae]MCK9689032.1 DUF3592 domain-containing protein [Scleromatobacter humisilvae]